MKRPRLRQIPLPTTMPIGLVITMSVGQWDSLLEVGYAQGYLILELDDNEVPIAAYQRPKVEEN